MLKRLNANAVKRTNYDRIDRVNWLIYFIILTFLGIEAANAWQTCTRMIFH